MKKTTEERSQVPGERLPIDQSVVKDKSLVRLQSLCKSIFNQFHYCFKSYVANKYYSQLTINCYCNSVIVDFNLDFLIAFADDDDSQAPMRKRPNLDHLSAEERMQRRKLKNRVAAQNAR